MKCERHALVCTFLEKLDVLEVFDPEDSMTYYFKLKEPVMSIQPPTDSQGVLFNRGEAWGYLDGMLSHRNFVGDVDALMSVIEEYDIWFSELLKEQDITIMNENDMVL